MTYRPTLLLKRRADAYGVPSIAPFVLMPDGNEWNVWDIPTAQYTPAVEQAIIHAFELGLRAHQQRVSQLNNESVRWKKDKP